MSSHTAMHRLRVKTLYKAYLKNALDWTIRRDIWRTRAIEIRAQFERNRHVTDPRRLEQLMQEAEAKFQEIKHPDPVIWPMFPGGTKYERNLPPPLNPALPLAKH